MIPEQERIRELISEAGEHTLFTGGASDDDIATLEDRLGVRLPYSYRWFLKDYGYGGVDGVTTLGIGKNGVQVSERVTKDHRAIGLPMNLVVVENCDEWQYCLDTAAGDADDCPVVSWEFGDLRPEYPSFYTYLIERYTQHMNA